MKRNFLVFTLLASLILAAIYTTTTISTQSDKPGVATPVILASIKPVQLIVQAIVGDAATVELLLSPATNPHHYQMRPSEVKKLHSADHFVWIGPGMEVFLPKVLASSTTPSTALMDFVKGSDDHDDNPRQADNHANHGTMEEHHHDQDTLHEGSDPHIWLDPLLVVEISAALAEELGHKYPQLQAEFIKNQKEFSTSIERLTNEFRVRLAKPEKRPVFTAHNAFSRLAERFNLHIQDFVTQSPELRPGAAHLQGLQNKIGSLASICFIQESPAPSTYLDMITKSTEVKQVSVDILASNILSDRNGYATLIYGVLSDIENCSRL